jgi:hypothetical protein
MANVKAIVGRDFGYANTVALSVAISETPIDLSDNADTNDLRMQSKKDAESFYNLYVVPGDIQVVERIKFEGRRFLAKIARYCDRIDQYKSTIDLEYHALETLRAEIFKDLNLSKNDLITQEMKLSIAGSNVGLFFHKIGRINDLKKALRALYKKITGIKKCWFGFLGNIEVALAKKYNAIIVREELTVEAIEKESPLYKGRTFNKILNNGSKGQYQKRSTDKHIWNRIPERAVPSFFS